MFSKGSIKFFLIIFSYFLLTLFNLWAQLYHAKYTYAIGLLLFVTNHLFLPFLIGSMFCTT